MGIIIGIFIYFVFCKKVEVWKLILASLLFNLAESVTQFANVKRYNLQYGIDDFKLNMVLMMLGKATAISLSVLPMTIMMMYVIPKNIEASMFAVVTGALTFSTDWGGDMVGAIVCEMFGISNEDMSRFGHAIIFKMGMTFLSILMIRMLPSNKEIHDLSDKMNNIRSPRHEQESYSDQIQSFLNEGGQAQLGYLRESSYSMPCN